MPMSENFQGRLYPDLKEIAQHFGTPFHIYDEQGIKETGDRLLNAFKDFEGFREYFAVKALPNPAILSLMGSMGFGFDCSSIPELVLSRKAGARADDIIFSSNNTTLEEFEAALGNGGSIINLDDVTMIDKLPQMPERICFRFNPGADRSGNDIIGNPAESKYGVTTAQIEDAYKKSMELGAKRFGLHTMLVSNELSREYIIQTGEMLLTLSEKISKSLGIKFEFINIGGGIGIPYKPEDPHFDLESLAAGIKDLYTKFQEKNGYTPRLMMECGRFMTGPHGVLVTTAINKKEIYRKYIGVDTCMAALMRPALYNAYHHIDVLGKMDESQATEVVDVVGSLCENNDKFAIQRPLPIIEDGDLLVIHDTGAHGHAMGFNYNGRLRPQELMLRSDGSVELIRREETIDDHFATLDFESNVYKP